MRKLVLRAMWLLCGLSCLLGYANAAPSAKVKGIHVEAEIVSARTALVPGQRQWLAIHLKMDPHWHVYWVNPGAAGFAPKIEWKLPEGLKAGPIQWPAPEKMKAAGLQAYVYEKEVYLPIELEIPKDGLPAKVSLKAHVSWLACQESCIPGQGDVELELPVAPKADPGPAEAAIDEARNHLPLKQGLDPVSLTPGGDKKVNLNFGLVTEGAVEKAEFFPYTQEVLDDDAPQPFKAEGKGGTLELSADKDKPAPKDLTGLLVVTQGGKNFPFDVNVTLGAAPTAASTPVPAAAAPKAGAPASLWEALIGAFIGGLILNLMPCVFPVLSLKVMGLVQHRDPSHKPHIHGLAFTAGVMMCFWLISGSLLALRAGGQKLGWGFQLQSPIFVASMACLFFLIALNLFGLFEVGEGLTQYGSYADGKTGYNESFWSGALATLVATPCSAPFMGAAVGYAITQPPALSLLIFTFLGLGMSAPYVLLTSFPSLLRFLPRPGVWMETFKQLMAFPMLATTVWFVYVLGAQTGTEGMALTMMALVFLGLSGWILGRWGWDPSSEGLRRRARFASVALGFLTLVALLRSLSVLGPVTTTSGASASAESIAWQPYTKEKVEEARKQGKPVFIDFTAEWCLSCKVNEKVALRNASVEDKFRQSGIVAFKADWTSRDAGISEILASFGRSGVPLYVYYPKGGEADVLPELITPQVVLDHLAK